MIEHFNPLVIKLCILVVMTGVVFGLVDGWRTGWGERLYDRLATMIGGGVRWGAGAAIVALFICGGYLGLRFVVTA